MEEENATGVVTALKSGSCLHLVCPKHIRDYLRIEDRDRLNIKIGKRFNEDGSVEKKPIKRLDLRKHLREIPRKEVQNEEMPNV